MSSTEHIVTRNLRCAICLEALTDPKLLSCLHTFCKECLSELVSMQPALNVITCLFCRSETPVKNGDVSTLPTNVPLQSLVLGISMIRDSGQLCDVCKAQPPSEQFCCDCKKNMCSVCHKTHSSWEPFREHRVVSVEDIKKGKDVLERKGLCNNHKPGDTSHNCTDVCLTCKKFICNQCRNDAHEKHSVESAKDYEGLFAEEVASLKEEAQFIRQRAEKLVDDVEGGNQTAHRETVEQLKEKNERLIAEYEAERTKLCQEFEKKKHDAERLILRTKSAKALAGNVSRLPLDHVSVALRESLYNKLKTLVGLEDPKESELRD